MDNTPVFPYPSTQNELDALYKFLIVHKQHFYILNKNSNYFCLNSEKTIFPINNLDKFLNGQKNEVYFHTTIQNGSYPKTKAFKIAKQKFDSLIKKYNSQFLKVDNFLFGCVAVKISNNAFIATIRGKEDLNAFCIVKKVNHKTNEIVTYNNKATLNAPMLDYLFSHTFAQYIVHTHTIDNNFPTLPFYFPGSKSDSERKIKTSFNIAYHGSVKLFDEFNKQL